MKKKYVTPEMEVVYLDVEDIITSSVSSNPGIEDEEIDDEDDGTTAGGL